MKTFNSEPRVKELMRQQARQGEYPELSMVLPHDLRALISQTVAREGKLSRIIGAIPVGVDVDALAPVATDVIETLKRRWGCRAYEGCDVVELSHRVSFRSRSRYWRDVVRATVSRLSKISDAPGVILSYHGDGKLKTRLLKLANEHRAADRYAQGTYGTPDPHTPACSVGCTVRDYNRERGADLDRGSSNALAIALGIPRSLAEINEGIFENLSAADAPDWPPAFLDALPVGVPHEVLADVARAGLEAAATVTENITGECKLPRRDLDGLAVLAGSTCPAYAARDAVLEALRNADS